MCNPYTINNVYIYISWMSIISYIYISQIQITIHKYSYTIIHIYIYTHTHTYTYIYIGIHKWWIPKKLVYNGKFRTKTDDLGVTPPPFQETYYIYICKPTTHEMFMRFSSDWLGWNTPYIDYLHTSQGIPIIDSIDYRLYTYIDFIDYYIDYVSPNFPITISIFLSYCIFLYN